MNEQIIAHLELHKQELIQTKESAFKIKAYANAINTIKACPVKITSGEQAKKMPGIGASIAAKITEILNNKTNDKAEDIERVGVLNSLQLVWGIGPEKAAELYNGGVRSVKELESCDTLTHAQKIGLKYYRDLQLRIDRSELAILEAKILNVLKVHKLKLVMQTCGSYRRGEPTCGDMDVLFTSKNCKFVENGLENLVKNLEDSGVLAERLALGPTKYMGIAKTSHGVAFRVDFEYIKPDEWPFALLYFTGSGTFNKTQRSVAKKMGYKLSEHGLFNTTTKEWESGINTEKDIFDFLKMKYLEPNERKK